MDFVKGIEGDYLETKKDGLIFDVKGLLHPRDRKICFLRFYEDPNGDRVKGGRKFRKVYELSERYAILKERFPDYLFYSSELDLEVQGVGNENIKHIYAPREYFQELREKQNYNKAEQLSKELCELFIERGNINNSSIGISGSQMVGLSKEASDIDIIVYGTKISLDFHNKLNDIFKESSTCRKYNSEEYKPHYQWRAGGSPVSFEDFLTSETRKLHQGKFKNVDFFVRFIKSPQDWGGNFYDFKYTNCGRIKVKAKIIDDSDSIFTPCSYKIDDLQLIENRSNLKELDLRKIIEINSFRGKFCEHAKNGEIVVVDGKLEKVKYKDNPEYYRILLGNQIKDFMIIYTK